MNESNLVLPGNSTINNNALPASLGEDSLIMNQRSSFCNLPDVHYSFQDIVETLNDDSSTPPTKQEEPKSCSSQYSSTIPSTTSDIDLFLSNENNNSKGNVNSYFDALLPYVSAKRENNITKLEPYSQYTNFFSNSNANSPFDYNQYSYLLSEFNSK